VNEAFHKEIVVFEEPQNAEVEYNIRYHHKTTVPLEASDRTGLPILLPHPYAAEPTAKGGQGNQDQEFPIPPAVKQIADHNHKQVLPPDAAVEHEPIEQKDSRQKQEKLYGIKKHILKQGLRENGWRLKKF